MNVLLECSSDTEENQGKCIYPEGWLMYFEGCLELTIELLDEAICTRMIGCCADTL